MRRGKTLPQRWLFTDERQGAALWRALTRLPRGSGVVFRHYGAPDRKTLFKRVERLTRRRGLLLVAGDADELGCARVSVHANSRRRRPGILTAAAHSVPELVRARRMGAALAFLSPVFPTASHPGGRTLGPVRFGLTARQAGIDVAALGGMNARRFGRLAPLGAEGWGAVGALTGK